MTQSQTQPRIQIQHIDTADGETLPSPRIVKGRLTFSGIAARAHDKSDPLQYETGPEYRREDQLDVIATGLVGQPIDIQHGGIPIGKVTAAKRVGNKVAVEYVIDRSDSDAKALVKRYGGLSLEYMAAVGSDRYQTIEKVDGLALCTNPRCGAACATRADAKPCCAKCAAKGDAENPPLLSSKKIMGDDADDDDPDACDPDDEDCDPEVDEEDPDDGDDENMDAMTDLDAATARLRARTVAAAFPPTFIARKRS